jgi:hypothetical protein
MADWGPEIQSSDKTPKLLSINTSVSIAEGRITYQMEFVGDYVHWVLPLFGTPEKLVDGGTIETRSWT